MDDPEMDVNNRQYNVRITWPLLNNICRKFISARLFSCWESMQYWGHSISYSQTNGHILVLPSNGVTWNDGVTWNKIFFLLSAVIALPIITLNIKSIPFWKAVRKYYSRF